jgi:hypothetical protein
MDHRDPVDVYQAMNAAEAEIIRGMLEAEGIRADVGGGGQGELPGILPEVAVMVPAGDADRARDLIRAHQATHVDEPEESTT